ncbi:MAG: nucleoside deaminase [Alphaproteobacteria bacterium]|nr:nucleoside deaminase [Alphaproteobacteria bacterium]
MKRAVELSALSLETASGRGPFGAVIVKNGCIIAEATNEVMKQNDPTCHAEVNCIRKACQTLKTYDLSGCDLYTSCEPCPMCLSAIIWANITKVYYANTAKQAGNIGFRDDCIYEWIKGEKTKLNLDLEHHKDDGAEQVFSDYQKQGIIY